MLGITTLEEYFSWIRNLGNISKKYTVLPLDEDHFEINTNTILKKTVINVSLTE